MPEKTDLLTRTVDLTSESVINEESRLVRLSFSSEEPYTRSSFFSEPWVEVLGHDAAEADFARLNHSGIVLYNHRGDRIGAVERAWIENGRGVAEIRFSKRNDPLVEGIWQDVKDGILRNVSVAYKILDRKIIEERIDKPDIYRVTRWEPREISLVDIPADPTVGVGRSDEEPAPDEPNLTPKPQPEPKEKAMPEALPTTPEHRDVGRTDSSDPLTTTQPNSHEAYERGAQEALAREDERLVAVRGVFEHHEGFDDLQQRCAQDRTIDQDQARKLLLDEMGRQAAPVSSGSRIEMGESDIEKFSRAAEDAIAFRVGMADENNQVSELRGYTLMEMARRCLELRGVRTDRLDKRELVGRAFTHSSSDFPKILENNARKAMLRGYDEAPEVFSMFTRAGNLSDFKIHNRVGMGAFESLDKIPEGGEYKHGTIGERGEPIQLATYGKLFSITRQAIINDDLSAFTEIPRKMGRAASRKVGDLVFGIINANPNMSDGKAVFHADHKNLAPSGAGPTAATVGAGRTAMRQQKDGDATLNIAPSYLLVPGALEDSARVLMASETDPSQNNSRRPNPVRNAAEVIVDARLDDTSLTSWYLAADPNRFDTIEVGYLDGVAAPFLDQQEGWLVDGAEYKVRIDAAAAPLEFRTLYKNPGA
jgi:hypothetical protein